MLACQSLEDVKQQFNCFEIVPVENGSSRIVEVTPVVTGQVHVFFGQVCGHLHVMGESLEEFYAGLKGYGGGEEKSIDQGE